jgi:hypothetical protein
MLKPVLGNVSVHEGVRGDAGESKKEEEPQRDGGQGGEQKEPKMLAHKLAHPKNIPQQ